MATEAKRKRRTPAAVATIPLDPAWPDPEPEQRPWLTDEDAARWRTVYVGDGRRGSVTSAMVIALTAEQWAWLDTAAEAAGSTTHDVVSRLIDQASAKG